MENGKPKSLLPETELHNLINDLLAEPFAQENQFGGLNLDQIGKELEEGRERLGEGEDSPEHAAHLRSHENCVSIYCMILMELESQGLSSPPEEPLLELTRRREGTIVVEIPPRETETRTPPPLQQAQPAPRAAREQPAPRISTEHPAPHVLSEEPKEEVMEDFPSPVFPGPEGEEMIQPNFESSGTFEEELPPEEEPMVFPDERENSAVGSQYEEEFKALLPDLTSAKARDHLEIALYFQLIRGGSFPFAPENADRLSGQSFCFALEAECAAKIAPIIPGFWAHRENAVRSILDAANRRFELHPQLRAGLDTLAKTNSQWLPDGQYPFAGTLSALRYIIATLQPENFQPSLMEAATLLFFFGQNLTLQGFALKNLLGVEGLQPAEITESAFRIVRTQRFRTKIMLATSEVTSGELDVLQEDLKRLFALLSKLKLGGVRNVKRAA